MALDFLLIVLIRSRMVRATQADIQGLALVLGIAGALTANRPWVMHGLNRLSRAAQRLVRPLRDTLAIAIAAGCSLMAIELPWNDALGTLPLASGALELALIALAMATLYFALQRNGAGPAIMAVLCCVGGIAQFFVLTFKGATILPSDILAIGTAAAVGTGYSYVIDARCLSAIGYTSIALLCLSWIRRGRSRTLPRGAAQVSGNLAVTAALCAIIGISLVPTRIDTLLGFSIDYWMPLNTYRERGFLPSFLAMLQDLPIPKPDGYTDEQAASDEQQLAAAYRAQASANPARQAAVEQFDTTKPAIIGIMNESFADLSIFNGLGTGYPGPTLLKSTAGLQKGALYTSVLGGGTANTEFEFLTGSSLAFVGGGKYPYTLYNFSHVNTLPRQLARLGYETTAMHAQNPDNWNRKNAYRQMGFDRFLSLEDFAGDPTMHVGSTDASQYQRIMDILKTDPDPQFIFDVTIQNHGGYDAVDVPAESVAGYVPANVGDDALRTQLTEYLALVDESDRALNQFLQELSQLDRPVIVVFFGDHQPFFTPTLNDALFPDEDEFAHGIRTYQTTYLVWSNYEVAGGNTQVDRESSPSSLAAELLDRIGAPLTRQQQAVLGAESQARALNLTAYTAADGQRYAIDDAASPGTATVDQLRRMQYREFAKKAK